MRRPRLAPAVARARNALRAAAAEYLDAAGRVQTADGSAETAAGQGSLAGNLLLVGLSGGRDSLAAAAAAAFVIPRLQGRVGAVIVDHGLQAGSEQISAKAAAQAQALGLAPVIIKRVSVGSTGGIEAAARTARYQAFREAMAETDAAGVILGHTLDDQAETVLLGLTRGSGAASLAGMRAIDGCWLRPFLGLTRAETGAICDFYNLDYWDDPHNENPRFMRSRIRHQAMPLLEKELGPGVAQALARTASLLRLDNDYLEELAAAALADCLEGAAVAPPAPGKIKPSRLTLSIPKLAAYPPPIRQRALRQALKEFFNISITYTQTKQLEELISIWHGQKPVDLPKLIVARRSGSCLVLEVVSARAK